MVRREGRPGARDRVKRHWWGQAGKSTEVAAHSHLSGTQPDQRDEVCGLPGAGVGQVVNLILPDASSEICIMVIS